MIFTTKKLHYSTADEEFRFKLTPPEGPNGEKYFLHYFQRTYADIVSIKAGPARYIDSVGESGYVPVFSVPGKEVSVYVKGPGYSIDDYFLFVWSRADAYKKVFDSHLLPAVIRTYTDTVPPGETGRVCFRNTTRNKIFNVVSLRINAAGDWSYLRINLDGEDIFWTEMMQGHYYCWGNTYVALFPIMPGSQLTVEAVNRMTSSQYLNVTLDCIQTTTKQGPVTPASDAISIFGLDKCVYGPLLPVLPGSYSVKDLEVLLRKPIHQTDPISEKVVRPPRRSHKVSPYVPDPSSSRDLRPTLPPAVDLKGSSALRTADETFSGDVTLPDEGKVVEVLPSPYGPVRRMADYAGRVRSAVQGYMYRSGKVEVSDSDWHNVWSGFGSRKLSFYAKAGDWEVQILTLYDKLVGSSISDADTIYIAEGQPFDAELEAVEVRVKCPGGSGTLYWEVEV